VIRNPAQKAAILEAGKNGPGQIDVLVESLEDVKSDTDAARVLEKTQPDYVVWSAGKSRAIFSIHIYIPHARSVR